MIGYRFWKGWLCTVRIMASALLHRTAEGSGGVCRLGTRSGTPAGTQGEFSFFFPGCRPIAAPLLLFRFKREGFSRCRADARADGVTVSCRR